MLPLIRGTGMLTLGSNQKNIDFEPEWRRRMQVCQIPGRKPQKPKGQRCMLEDANLKKLFWFWNSRRVLPHRSYVTPCFCPCQHGLGSCHLSGRVGGVQGGPQPPHPAHPPTLCYRTSHPGTPMVLRTIVCHNVPVTSAKLYYYYYYYTCVLVGIRS